MASDLLPSPLDDIPGRVKYNLFAADEATEFHRKGDPDVTCSKLKRKTPPVPAALGCLAVILGMLSSRAFVVAAETLYNGIELPTPWPPRVPVFPDSLTTPPYLVSPPTVIPIDVGRQLLIDDFLIEESTLSRRFHRPTYHPANPVLTPDKEWEQAQGAPMAMPYSGGVWFDPADEKFKAWYMGGYNQHLCYAESHDGVTWTKPALDVVQGTNIVLPGGATESNTLWLDLNEKDPKRRCKFFTERGGAIGNLVYRASQDGIHDWTGELWESGRCGDRTTVFYNPFRDKWVINVRESYSPGRRGRSKRYAEVEDINDRTSVDWPAQDNVPLWVTADRPMDAPNPEIGFAPQLYHLDCMAYESVMLGLFSIFRGYFHADSGEGRLVYPGRPKHNDVCVGFSRDGFHWHRPDHRPFLTFSDRRGDWNWGNMQSVGGGILVVGDYLYIYCSGRAGEGRGTGHPLRYDADGSMGLAVLRRDGFASMDAGASGGTLTTRKLRFGGKHLFVNTDAVAGELRVEVLDGAGKVFDPFTKENCNAIRANGTAQPVAWKGATDLSNVSGKVVRFRFSLTNGRLYAFWVSPDMAGASQGYVGAGGPGFTSHRDTTGLAAFPNNRPPLVDAGADQTLREQSGQGKASVTLDASRSVDPDGRIETFDWRENGQPMASGSRVTVMLPPGTHSLTLTASDDGGAVGYGNVRVAVRPQEDPVPLRDGLVLWLKADAIQGLDDGDAVQVWPDGAETHLDPFQPDPAKQPLWKKNAIHGLPAVRFDGVDDNLRTRYYRDLLFTSSKVSVLAVFKASGAVETRGLVSSDWAGFCT
ncbi:MAG TPA: hypothetical protein VND64_07425, partial [Pirellulales bacterium]|nr:hypothetical protein [Pirellulales bacterium]